MMTLNQQYTVQYGPPGRYFVRDEASQQPVYSGDSKSAVISEAEHRNGWPITGSANGYADARERLGKPPSRVHSS